MTLSADELLSIARTYWPSNGDGGMQTQDSPEFQRLRALWGREMETLIQWRSFTRGLRSDLPGFILGNLTTLHDACFRCGAYPDPQPASHSWAVIGCMSILAPVYSLYGFRMEVSGKKLPQIIRRTVIFEPLPPEMQRPAEVLARRIEETYGVTRLPRELAEIPVPLFVKPVEPPHTTLFHALFLGQLLDSAWG